MTHLCQLRGLFCIVLGYMLVLTCAANQSMSVELRNTRLAPCPASPNCVSSDATAKSPRYVPPYKVCTTAHQAWTALRQILENQPRTRIVTDSQNYLHVEVRSRFFGFIDDMELEIRPQEVTIAVRSASRTGYYDFGVNRKRVEIIRDQLREMSVVCNNN